MYAKNKCNHKSDFYMWATVYSKLIHKIRYSYKKVAIIQV